ncbi:MAG: polyphosphate kinase 1 [Deltaproteobacteria bacterium]|nr:polyphosphate kinase 1 [Deltaproteobacteria bacterium]
MSFSSEFINRELSWLEFNGRVLEEALDSTVPLAERLKFLAIATSNLDEFFMVRVAGIKQQITSNVIETTLDGRTPQEQLAAISAKAHLMVEAQYRCYTEDVQPALERAGVSLIRLKKRTAEQKQFLASSFINEVFPVLTPLAVDPNHPFPHLGNRSLNVAVVLSKAGRVEKLAPKVTMFGVVQVPSVLPRLVEIPSTTKGARAYAFLEDVIAAHAADLFPGFKVLQCHPFRVTRNFDLFIDEEEAEDLLPLIQKELRRRERGAAVRLEVGVGTDQSIVDFLQKALRLEPLDVYQIDGPLNLTDLAPIVNAEELGPKDRDEVFSQQYSPAFPRQEYIHRIIGQRDVLLHHPYEAFEDVVEFIEEAANDPDVLAIKQTLYRTSRDSPVVRALTRAAENGKQVTAVVELKARFDEGSNIRWARTLEEAGVHVVYGLIGLKTHCKVALVVRREGKRLRRYVHLGTGNYNPITARVYSDLSFFTCRPEFGEDASALFNLLTGYSMPPSWRRLAVAPVGLSERVRELIDREASHGPRGRIIAKMNSLSDREIISSLCRASQAGVQIDLVVRGICCLRPGVPGKSENIRVISVVDRFLEHSRIFVFDNDGNREVYLSSADWMERNFVRRVEVMFPVEDEAIRQRLVDEILGLTLADNAKARVLEPDGTYTRRRPADAESAVRSQVRFLELARAAGIGVYDPSPGDVAKVLLARPRPDEEAGRPTLV